MSRARIDMPRHLRSSTKCAELLFAVAVLSLWFAAIAMVMA